MLLRFLLLDILIACILDLIIGDPEKLPHPVKFIGKFLKVLEKYFLDNIGEKYLDSVKTFSRNIKVRTKRGRLYQKFAGFLVLFIVIGASFFPLLILMYAVSTASLLIFSNYVIFHIFNIFFLYTSISSKSLSKEVYNVFYWLDERNLFQARSSLSRIVGRETTKLTEPEIVRASIETTAESTVDGIVTPLFYAVIGAFLGGIIMVPIVYIFKATSTLDSMIGYKNDRYMYFGYACAKADDILNYIPARITGIFIIIATFVLRLDYKGCLKILIRDRQNHESPNSGYPEAAFAGALNVTLGGTNIYFGKKVEKPLIGDSGKDIIKNDIVDSIRLMFVTFFISIFIFILISFTIAYFLIGNF